LTGHLHPASTAERKLFTLMIPYAASDDDPSGIGTYAVAGASLGYATLWTAIGLVVTWGR